MISLKYTLDVSQLPRHLQHLETRRVSAGSLTSAEACIMSVFYADERELVRITDIQPTNILGEPLSFS
jgi:hypothetical protein